MMSNTLIMAYGSLCDQCAQLKAEMAYLASIDSTDPDFIDAKKAYELAFNNIDTQRANIEKMHPEAKAFIGTYHLLRKGGN